MKIRRLGILITLLLSACGQQESLELEKDQVFSKQFPANQLVLADDDGRDVTIQPRAVTGSSSRGFTSENYYQGCNSIYGCAQNPYSSYLGYSNYAHSWNPSITRTINLNFGQRGFNSFDPFAVSTAPGKFCVNLNVTSSQAVTVLRTNIYNWQAGGGNNTVSGSGSNTVNIRAQVLGSGSVILSIQDRQALQQQCPQQYGQGWNQGNWWDYGNYYYPPCSAPLGQVTLKITGTAGLCSAPQQVTLDLSAQVNTQQGYENYGYYSQGYNMPYFQHPAGIWGRVLQYSGQAGVQFWGM
jgi:hypothetical protein